MMNEDVDVVYDWVYIELNDAIVKLNNLMLIDLYNHQLKNHMNQIMVQYQVKMDRKYLEQKKNKVKLK